MSEHDESDDKITVLFPDTSSQERDRPEPGEGEQSEELPQSAAAPPTDDDNAEELGEDNVVRLDFERESTQKSPRPRRGFSPEIATADPGNEKKYEIFRQMIDGGMVMVTLDTRHDDVEIPSKFRGLPELRLNFSHMFHIDDFDYDLEGVRASLSFQGKRFFCQIPWAAVFMLYSHETGKAVVFDPLDPDPLEPGEPDHR